MQAQKAIQAALQASPFGNVLQNMQVLVGLNDAIVHSGKIHVCCLPCCSEKVNLFAVQHCGHLPDCHMHGCSQQHASISLPDYLGLLDFADIMIF